MNSDLVEEYKKYREDPIYFIEKYIVFSSNGKKIKLTNLQKEQIKYYEIYTRKC